MAQGSGGAFEVSQRMTALLGWGGTTKFAEALVSLVVGEMLQVVLGKQLWKYLKFFGDF